MASWKTYVYPLITLLVILLAWTAAIETAGVPTYILPRPDAVLAALKKGYIDGQHYPHLFHTLKAMIIGYFIGCGSAVVIGSLLAEFKFLDRFIYPYIVALQSMPKVALAPLIILWFGFGIESKIVIVALICFFPVLINTLVGVRQADPNLLDLMRAFSSSRLYTFFQVKLPSAASHIFAGLQISIVLALIGAVVAEFVASRYGLGQLVQVASIDLNTSLMFAALIALATIGIIGTQLVRFIHAKVVFWEDHSGDRHVGTAEGG